MSKYPDGYVALAEERQLIVGLMAHDAPNAKAWRWLRAADFYGDLHRVVFAILRSGPLSPERIEERCRQRGWSGPVADILRDYEMVVPATSARVLEQCARTIHTQAQRRRLRSAARSLLAQLDRCPEGWNEKLEEALRLLRSCRA